jgi:uncharacterized membrane protein YphA (DoxX/SURF4 family)
MVSSNAISLPASSRTPTWILWTLQPMAAAIFLSAGIAKLVSATVMVQLFAIIGMGQWFRYATGLIEVGSALVLLLVPRLAFAAAVMLAMTMVGAVTTHLFITGGSPAPAIILLAITATIAWLRQSGS